MSTEPAPTQHAQGNARGDPRATDRLRAHYEVERELGDRLRRAPAAERRALYAKVYDELYARVPDHPQLTRKSSVERSETAVTAQYRLLRRFLTRESTFLEIGAGDCAVSLRACADAGQVIAADVSDAITSGEKRPSNFRLVLFDGCELGLPDASVDVAYSNQVIEHLHPEDAVTQLRSILRVLKPGGAYVCVTPNRVNGPHDVSRFFDKEATGFHMKEYTHGELAALMRQVGFVDPQAVVGVKGKFAAVPVPVMRAVDAGASLLPRALRRRLDFLLERLLMVRIVGRKPRA